MTEKSNIVVLQAESHVIDDIEAGGIHLGDLRDIIQEKSENLGIDAQEGAGNHQHGGDDALDSSQESEEQISLAQHMPELNPHTDSLSASLQSLALFIGIQESASAAMLVKTITTITQGNLQEEGWLKASMRLLREKADEGHFDTCIELWHNVEQGMHSRLLKCSATSATMDDTMRALVKGLKEAREVHGLKELLARKWCTSALVRARIAVEMCEANAGIARHEQCMLKRCKDAEDAALDAVIQDLGKRGASWSRLISESVQREMHKRMASEQLAGNGGSRSNAARQRQDTAAHTPQKGYRSKRSKPNEAVGVVSRGAQHMPRDQFADQAMVEECRYGIACRYRLERGARRCRFRHTQEQEIPERATSNEGNANARRSLTITLDTHMQRKCKFGARCNKSGCLFKHPPARQQLFQTASERK
jgi:hypothetical protein